MIMKLSLLLFFLSLHNIVSARTIGNHHPHKNSDGRIINGHAVRPHSVPYMVALTVRHKNGIDLEVCGGSLLSDRHVLTAAHCLHEEKTIHRLQFAAHDRFSDESFQVERKDATFVIHKDHDNSTSTHDIALIKLKDPVDTTNPFIQTVSLPDPKDANKTFDLETVETFGWGWTSEFVWPYMDRYPDELMGLNLTVLPLNDCRTEARKANILGGAVYDYEICTSSHDPLKPVGTCHGDSGSPLIYNKTLIGLTSRGPTWFCSHNEPSIFVSVGQHLEWIKEQMKNM